MKRPSRFTLSNVFQNSFKKYPDQLALRDIKGKSYTYREVESKVLEMQNLLRSHGISKGDKVALLGQSSPNWVISYVAVTTMSAVAVPILPDFAEESIQNIINHGECRMAIISSKFDKSVDPKNHSQLRGLINMESLSVSWSSDEQAPPVNQTIKPEENDLAAIIYTSGTTGSSKGVMLSHRNIAHNAWAGVQVISLDTSDCMLSVLPLAHTFECTLGMVLPLMCGASVHYVDKRPTAAVLLPALEDVRPTLMLTVPLIIEKIFKLRILPKINESAVTRTLYKIPLFRKLIHKKAGKKLYEMFGGRLRFFGVGGAALAPDVERFLKDANFPYAIGYGLTETSPLAAGSHPDDTRLLAIGPAASDVQIKIDKREGSEGEVLIKGPNVMMGYYKDPANTEAVLSEDGWLRTGDLGHISKDGYLFVKGRLKNMLLGPSGENIYPEEIEAVLGRFELVLESVVTQQLGALVARVHVNREILEKQFNELKSRGEKQFDAFVQETLEDIRRNVNKRVSSFARIQKIIEELEPFEKTPTNKIKRYLYNMTSPSM